MPLTYHLSINASPNFNIISSFKHHSAPRWMAWIHPPKINHRTWFLMLGKRIFLFQGKNFLRFQPLSFRGCNLSFACWFVKWVFDDGIQIHIDLHDPICSTQIHAQNLDNIALEQWQLENYFPFSEGLFFSGAKCLVIREGIKILRPGVVLQLWVSMGIAAGPCLTLRKHGLFLWHDVQPAPVGPSREWDRESPITIDLSSQSRYSKRWSFQSGNGEQLLGGPAGVVVCFCLIRFFFKMWNTLSDFAFESLKLNCSWLYLCWTVSLVVVGTCYVKVHFQECKVEAGLCVFTMSPFSPAIKHVGECWG